MAEQVWGYALVPLRTLRARLRCMVQVRGGKQPRCRRGCGAWVRRSRARAELTRGRSLRAPSAGCAQDAAGPPGSPPIEDLPETGSGPGAGGLVKERPKGSVKLFVGQIGREMDADGYRLRLFRRRAYAGPARARACVRAHGPAWDGRLIRYLSRLRSLLEPHGEVHDASIIKDRATGQSKGTVHAREHARSQTGGADADTAKTEKRQSSRTDKNSRAHAVSMEKGCARARERERDGGRKGEGENRAPAPNAKGLVWQHRKPISECTGRSLT
jgi:hypothetical protein